MEGRKEGRKERKSRKERRKEGRKEDRLVDLPSGALRNSLAPLSLWQPLKYWKTAVMSLLGYTDSEKVLGMSHKNEIPPASDLPTIIGKEVKCLLAISADPFQSLCRIDRREKKEVAIIAVCVRERVCVAE
ncbi:hypothetical protein L345_07000, partial [Ophiophagus hannah]